MKSEIKFAEEKIKESFSKLKESKTEDQKNNVPPHTKVCGLLQALVFWMLRN